MKCSAGDEVQVDESCAESELVLVSHDEQELCLLIEEAGCRGVLDTGCSRSVAGFTWINNYTNSISQSYAETLKVMPSTKIYQFGGREKRSSQGKLSIPVVIRRQRSTLRNSQQG